MLKIVNDPEELLEVVIPFIAIVGANAQIGIIGNVPHTPYTVLGGIIYFPNDAVDNVQVRFLYASENTFSTTGISSGENLFVRGANTPFFVGHASSVNIQSHIKLEDPDNYLKMHVVNNNAYAITVMGILNVRLG